MVEKFKPVDENQLSFQLIEAQYYLKSTKEKSNAKSLVILINGIEMAGKGEALKQLREWVDPRFLRVKADPPQPFDGRHALWQPYANFMPAEGQILVILGNWYTDLISAAVQKPKQFNEQTFDDYVQKLEAFEQDLKNNHVDVIKVWFDLSWKTLQKRLDKADEGTLEWHKMHSLDWREKKYYDQVQTLRQRFTDSWLVIDGEDEHRDQRFAQWVLKALQDCPEHRLTNKKKWQQQAIPQALLTPSNDVFDKEEYKEKLKRLTRKVAEALRADGRKIVLAFEGMDAAGKGGAIKRIVQKLDPREYEIHSIGSPENYELRRPYLWRFWTKLQPHENIIIFDRTWYGRVLVERVEGYAEPAEWQRAYEEINRFEQDLYEHQTLVIKFWLAIDADEQAKRFKEREQTPHKRFKITPEDWRNRERWDDYLNAAADMFAYTHTAYAPWHIVATNDKNTARIEILETILQHLHPAEEKEKTVK